MHEIHIQENVLISASLLQSYCYPSSVLWVIRLMVSASSGGQTMDSVCYQCPKSTLGGVWSWRCGSLHPHSSSLIGTIFIYFLTSTCFLVIGILVQFKSCPITSPNLCWYQGCHLLHYDRFAWSDLYPMWYSQNWRSSRAGNGYFSDRQLLQQGKLHLGQSKLWLVLRPLMVKWIWNLSSCISNKEKKIYLRSYKAICDRLHVSSFLDSNLEREKQLFWWRSLTWSRAQLGSGPLMSWLQEC